MGRAMSTIVDFEAIQAQTADSTDIVAVIDANDATYKSATSQDREENKTAQDSDIEAGGGSGDE